MVADLVIFDPSKAQDFATSLGGLAEEVDTPTGRSWRTDLGPPGLHGGGLNRYNTKGRIPVIDYKRRIAAFARRNGLEIIYAFGSRAKEIQSRIHGQAPHSTHPRSDLDLGIKPARLISVKEKVRIAIFFEDLFDISRVDVVSLPEAPASLGVEIVSGELLYAANDKNEADCQLYYMRRAADLLPFERERAVMILGASK